MAAYRMTSHDRFLVLFSNTHVMFLRGNEQNKAEVIRTKNIDLLNGTIEPVKALPTGIQMGIVYRHHSPEEKETFQ